MRAKALIVGARPHSLGAALVSVLRNGEQPMVPLAIDVEDLSGVSDAAATARVDLNPFRDASDWRVWHSELRGAVDSLSRIQNSPFRCLVLANGKYDVGPFDKTTAEQRAEFVGAGILGKLEILHAVMASNRAAGYENSAELCLVDVGSLHSIRNSPQRFLYNASKALSLALCQTVARCAEVRRVIHLAPGPIDTPMLHGNHWTIKAHGDSGFFERVRLCMRDLYQPIFLGCDLKAFRAAVERVGLVHSAFELEAVFERYVAARAEAIKGRDGVIDPCALALLLGREILNGSVADSEIIEVTAPRGVLTLARTPLGGKTAETVEIAETSHFDI